MYTVCQTTGTSVIFSKYIQQILTSINNWWFSVPQFVNIGLGLLEIFQHITGVRFFETWCSFMYLLFVLHGLYTLHFVACKILIYYYLWDNHPIFLESLQARSGALEVDILDFLSTLWLAECLSCRPTRSVEALTDELLADIYLRRVDRVFQGGFVGWWNY